MFKNVTPYCGEVILQFRYEREELGSPGNIVETSYPMSPSHDILKTQIQYFSLYQRWTTVVRGTLDCTFFRPMGFRRYNLSTLSLRCTSVFLYRYLKQQPQKGRNWWLPTLKSIKIGVRDLQRSTPGSEVPSLLSEGTPQNKLKDWVSPVLKLSTNRMW